MENQNNTGSFYPQDNPVAEPQTITTAFGEEYALKQAKRKKSKKRVGIVFLIFLIIAGVFLGLFINEQNKQIEEWKSKDWFVFSTKMRGTNDDKYLTADELKAYEPKREIYSAEYYYGKLSEDDKLIYKAYLYALDNNYIYTYIDDVFVKGDNTALDILVFLSLDSGFIQQNLESTEFDSTKAISTTIMGRYVEKQVEGFTVKTKNFSKERLENTQKAVDKLKEVKFNFPSSATDEEKVEKIYQYIGENMNYAKKYENADNVTADTDSLYEAVFEKDTNCDGFANSFSMLCYLNGIKCVEKSSETKKDEVGHTWNAALIDGKWYNIDCTESVDEKKEDIEHRKLVSLGVSDSLLNYKVAYKNVAPECKDNLIPLKKTFASCSNELVSFMASALKGTKNVKVLVLVEKASEKEIDNTAQRIADRLYGSFSYSSCKVLNGTLFWMEKK